MRPTEFQRWQWIVIALIVGMAVGLVQNASNSDGGGIYVDGALILTGQQQFENALVEKYNGQPLFADPTVYAHQMTAPDGRKETVDVVTGSYWNGDFHVENGREVGHYVRRAFVAQRPYRPMIDIPMPKGMAPPVEYSSVAEFLAALHHSFGVNYRVAWWANHLLLTWALGCLIVVGGILPTTFNLLTYGRLTRPADAPRASLPKLRRPKLSKELLLSQPQVQSLEQPRGDTGEPTPTGPESGNAHTGEVRVAALEAGPLEPLLKPEEKSHEYSANADDYYPTERRGGLHNGAAAAPPRASASR